MMRTSLVLPPVLFQQLEQLARKKRKPFSALIRDALSHYVSNDSEQGLEATYNALWKMNGMVKSDITDTSTTIDDVLYGENGIWRGEPGKQGMWTLPIETTSNEN